MPGVTVTLERPGGLRLTQVSDTRGHANFKVDAGGSPSRRRRRWTLAGSLQGTHVETKSIVLHVGDDETVDLEVAVFPPGATLVPDKC
jgi:hypothetical protein